MIADTTFCFFCVLAALAAGTFSRGPKLTTSVVMAVSWAFWIVFVCPFDDWYDSLKALSADAVALAVIMFACQTRQTWRWIAAGAFVAQIFCHLGYIFAAFSSISQGEFGKAYYAYRHVLDALFFVQVGSLIGPGASDVLGSLFHAYGGRRGYRSGRGTALSPMAHKPTRGECQIR